MIHYLKKQDATKRFLDKDGIPDLFGSFSLDASYGNFDLSSVFTYQIGGWSSSEVGESYGDGFPLDSLNKWFFKMLKSER